MKALGIVRKIDNLGRVVIPKEIRKSNDWDEGQPMEMFMDGEKLVLQAYGKDKEKEEVVEKIFTLLDTTKLSKEQNKTLHEIIDYIEGDHK